MKRGLSLLNLASAALASYCSKEVAAPDSTGRTQEESVLQTFTASQESFIDNGTKATFDNGINWQLNDEIAVSDGTNKTFFPISGQINWTASALWGAYLGESSDATTATAEAYGRLWTRDTNESTGRSIMQVRGYISAGNTWEKRGNNFSIFDNKKAYGFAVRCVKE